MENLTNETGGGGGLTEEEQIAFIQISNFIYDEGEKVGLIVELLIFLVVGLFGNGLLLSVFFQRIKMYRTSYIYNYMIFALAISDVITLAFYIPMYLLLKIPVVYSNAACQFIEFGGSFLLWYGQLMICIGIPLERFFAICKPLTKFGRREAYIILGCNVVVCVGLAVPFGYYSTVYAPNGALVGCHFDYFSYVGGVVIPTVYLTIGLATAVIAIVAYAAIFAAIIRFRRTMKKMVTKSTDAKATDTSTNLGANTRVVFMLFGVTMYYFVCWIPYYLIVLQAIPLDNRYKVLFFLNNATNFILYGVMNEKVRLSMWATLRCGKEEVPSPKTSAVTAPSGSQNTLDDKSVNQDGAVEATPV